MALPFVKAVTTLRCNEVFVHRHEGMGLRGFIQLFRSIKEESKSRQPQSGKETVSTNSCVSTAAAKRYRNLLARPYLSTLFIVQHIFSRYL